MKKALSITAAVVVALILLIWLGGTWFLGSAIKNGIEQADAENESFNVSDYRKGFFSSNFVTDLGGVEESSFSLRQEMAHGPLALVDGGPKVCASHITTKLNVDSQPEGIKKVLAKLFGEGVEPFIAETSVSFAGTQSTNLKIASANNKSEDLEVRFDGAEIDWNLASDKSEFDLQGNCPPLYLKGANTSEDDGSIAYTIRADGFDLSADYEKGEFLKSDSKWGKIRASFKTDDERPIKIEMKEMTVDADMKSMSEELNYVWLGNTRIEIAGLNLISSLGEGMPTGEYGIDALTFSSNITDNKDGTINAEGGYELAGINGSAGEDNPMAGLFNYLSSGAQVKFKLKNAPYELVQNYSQSQMEQYNELINLASATAKDPSAATRLQQKLNTQNAETMIESLKQIKNGLNIGYQILIAPGDDQTKLGFDLTYTNDQPLTSLKTVGELIKSMELKVDGIVASGAIEAFPMLGMMLQPQVEGGMLKADASGNYTISALLKEAQLTVNDQPSPMQMMVEMFSEQELDWDAIKESIANPGAPGEEVE